MFQALHDYTPGDRLYQQRWRKALLIAIPFGAAAFLIGLVLEHPSNQATALDIVGYALMAGVLIVLEGVLAFLKRSLHFVVLSIISGASLFFLVKLAALLFFLNGSVDLQAQLTETFYWVPVVYLLSFILPGQQLGRRVAVIFTTSVLALCTAYTGAHLLSGAYVTTAWWGILYALMQMNLANSVLLALTIAFINFKEDYTRAYTRVEAAELLARTDALTGLPNRQTLQERLEDICVRRDSMRAAVLFIDLDGFKLINDTLGHEAGDELLKQVAERLRGEVRRGDLLVRISGDEFVCIVEYSGERQHAEQIAHKLLGTLAEPFYCGGQHLNVTASIGVSLFPDHGQDGATLLRHADSAMYRVKRLGKAGVAQFFGDLDGQFEKQREIERYLRSAVQKRQLHLEYQPLYDLTSGRLIKLEALLRWHHPQLGRVSPADFIPSAERSGAIIEIGSWVLDEACHQAKVWSQQGFADFRVSVNVSPLQFAQPDFYTTVVEALERHQLPAGFLELELTESAVMQGVRCVATTLDKLQRLGVSLAIDDFGTGYSSLAYLKDLPIDTVKIDRSFVKDLCAARVGPQFALALIEAIMSLAVHLDLQVVAEGIETEEQRDLLRHLGCHVGQGYFFAKPLPAEALAHLFRPQAEPVKLLHALVN